MIKKILFFIFIFLLNVQMIFAQEFFKITSVNLDTSNSLVLLTSSVSKVSENINNIKINSLENPKRFYFDLNSTTLNTNPQNWFFNLSDIKQIKISQFDTQTVRVVLYTSDNFDKSKISIMKQNKSLILKFKDEICQTDYFEPIYTDEKISSSKFYENLSISNTEIDKIKSAQNMIKKDTITEVQEAFSNQVSPQSESIIKDLKLKTNYFISSFSTKNEAILISGFGGVQIEKPMYLTEPYRIVYDFPNSITNYSIRNKVHTSNGTMIKMGQFDAFRSRLVITPASETVDYIPVISPDGQSILFIKNTSATSNKLFNKTNNANGYYMNKKNELIISFDAPVVHSIKRDNDKLTVKFYNTYSFNEERFKKTVSKTIFQDTTATLMPKVGLSLEIPITKSAVVKTYMGADGKAVKILLNNVTLPSVIKKQEPKEKVQKVKGKRIVVIDAGHGGSDYGAIREGINEKDINLDVAKMVVEILTKAGVTTIMTRDSDEFISLADRVDFSTKNDADLFVSVHVNASVKPEISGLETHYYNENSLDFANTVHFCMVDKIKRKDRGIFKSKFYVINHNAMPAILVEIGFISNEEERKELITQDRKQKTAKAIADGIIKYLNEN